MVAPYNYAIQAPSAFESLVSGLKIGTSLQEMEAQRQQRMLQAQAMQQKMENERRRQEMLQGLRQKPFAQWGSNDLLTAVETLPKEGLTFLQQQMAAMSADERRARAMEMGTLASIALSGNKDMLASQFDERIELAPTPQAKQSLMAQKQAALLNPEAFAKYATGILPALGDEGKNVAENLLKVHGGLKATEPAQLPERAQLAQWYQTATPEQKQAYNQLFPPEVRSLTEAQRLEWYKNLPETDRALFDQLLGAGKAPLVQNVLPGQPTPPTKFEEAVDNKGAQIYVSWALEGGAANATARIAALENEVKKLEASATGKGPTLSGVQIQVIPEVLRPLLVPAAQEARQNAERVIQEGLRPILGAQFTKEEGERFLARAFDPALGADRNARRLRLILEQMKASAKQAQAVSDYAEKNKSLIGFKGVYPSLAQFEAVLAKDSPPEREGRPAAQTAPTAPAASARRREIAPGVFVTERQ